jgi:hypothetical protein
MTGQLRMQNLIKKKRNQYISHGNKKQKLHKGCKYTILYVVHNMTWQIQQLPTIIL